jgi:formylglycine-generating enzyme required for sulfatase activity
VQRRVAMISEPSIAPSVPTLPSSKSLLPVPFDWCRIPAGKVTVNNTIFEVPTFEIAKYPVTNAQFAKFIEAKGYQQQKWWTETGWTIHEQEKWTEPRYWNDTQWNGKEHPVVGVSWYEAMAFCAWLSETTGEKIMLPTEQQWQRAVQAKPDGGDSGRAYVWGNAWDGKKCNNSVKPEDSNCTTPVTQFEKAGNVSLCGVVDLIGNVWEWCLTEYESGSQNTVGTNVRVLRGGSWVNVFTENFRAGFRDGFDPHGWLNNRGFRLSRS